MCWIACTKRGMIGNPVGKTKSVVFTDKGLKRAKTLFEALFVQEP